MTMPDQKPTLEYAEPERRGRSLEWVIFAAIIAMLLMSFLFPAT